MTYSVIDDVAIFEGISRSAALDEVAAITAEVTNANRGGGRAAAADNEPGIGERYRYHRSAVVKLAGWLAPFTCHRWGPLVNHQAIAHWQQNTRIRFKRTSANQNSTRIGCRSVRDGCWSSVGMAIGQVPRSSHWVAVRLRVRSS